MSLLASPPKGKERLVLYFGTTAAPLIRRGGIIDMAKHISCPVLVDGKWHSYTVDMSDIEAWDGTIDELALSPVNLADVFVEIRSLRFYPGQ